MMRPYRVYHMADRAWDNAFAPSRLPLNNPERIPYTETARQALRSYRDVLDDYDNKHGEER